MKKLIFSALFFINCVAQEPVKVDYRKLIQASKHKECIKLYAVLKNSDEATKQAIFEQLIAIDSCMQNQKAHEACSLMQSYDLYAKITNEMPLNAFMALFK